MYDILPKNIITMLSLFISFWSDSSSLGISEESELLKRQRSLYIDLGALAGYFNIVQGSTTLDYE